MIWLCLKIGTASHSSHSLPSFYHLIVIYYYHFIIVSIVLQSFFVSLCYHLLLYFFHHSAIIIVLHHGFPLKSHTWVSTMLGPNSLAYRLSRRSNLWSVQSSSEPTGRKLRRLTARDSSHSTTIRIFSLGYPGWVERKIYICLKLYAVFKTPKNGIVRNRPRCLA